MNILRFHFAYLLSTIFIISPSRPAIREEIYRKFSHYQNVHYSKSAGNSINVVNLNEYLQFIGGSCLSHVINYPLIELNIQSAYNPIITSRYDIIYVRYSVRSNPSIQYKYSESRYRIFPFEKAVEN